MWRLSVYLHMYTMYGDYSNMYLLHNIKTMQIYKFTHNPVLLPFVHQRFIANSLIPLRNCSNELRLDLWKQRVAAQLTRHCSPFTQL